ncbi:alpha/beta fold hydrolase [Mesorhizobium sp. J428]|uniref:alpha/beta fold hydrolase n=1 Tax=Mesorhizobium sp. J428 TaxID=2898440 RepID=UPI002151BCE2|nr:alpha/beta fold hydrolase [Mesorhizobium sp. J428]MCR5856676.1 alpha/beta fold hydrolase [Mesorhizobium sp. J428]
MPMTDDLSDIIDRIYDVAVDPIRFEEMLDSWEPRLSRQRRIAERRGWAVVVDEVEQHIRRADTLLNQFIRDDPSRRGPLDTQVSAFLVGPDMTIVDANSIAATALSASPAERLDCLPLDAADTERLRSVVRRTLRDGEAKPSLLRFNLTGHERSIVFHVSPRATPDGLLALIRATELGWPEHLTHAMREAFALSAAEIEIVRALAEGRSLKVIADLRGRSLATVRTQVAAILAKTDTHSQTELVRITLGLMDVIGPPTTETKGGEPPQLAEIPFHTMNMPDGRRYDWIEFGAPGGRPLLFLPLDYGFIRWPASAEAAAAERNIRVVVPVRAGYGRSAPQPKVANYTDATAADLERLLKQVNIRQCTVLALGSDIRFAVALANAAPGLVRGIFGCSADLPVTDIKQYERMHKWHRFTQANARYAPRLMHFILKAGFALARRMGKDAFFRRINAGSPADLAAFDDPEIREAILVGSTVSLSPDHSAHEAVARECIDSEIDWSDRLRTCTVPIRLLQGADDPQAHPDTVREWQQSFPNLDIEIVEDAGQLLFFQHWRRVLAELECYLPH